MGNWNFGQYGAPHKVRMGWLDPSNVVTTEANGSFTVLPYETATGGVQALKLRRGTGNNAWLWLEYRQPVAPYDSTLNLQVFTGGLVHYEDSTTGTHTHLLDFTPASTSNFADPSLTGNWSDPYSNVSISVTGASASGLSVNVAYGPVPCVRSQPTVTLSPPNPSVYSGSNAAYTATITNNDSTGCPASTFDLGSTLPAWTTSFSANSLTLNPTQSGNLTMTKSVPAAFTPGTYPVDATASNANHSTATGSANCTVTTPPEPIAVSQLTALPGSVSARATVTIQATITKNGGVPVSGATVTFNMARPGGTTISTATTNSSGIAQWKYKTQQKGAYSVTVTATSGGMTASGGPVTFTAN